MAKKFDELRKKMSPERRRRNREAVDLGVDLGGLRTSMTTLSQADVAGFLGVTQGYISRLESRGDMSVIRLQSYVRALGGELEVRAKFEDREIDITLRIARP